jgi:hypothetical protein
LFCRISKEIEISMKTLIFLVCSALAVGSHAQGESAAGAAVSSAPAAAVSTFPPVNLTWDHTPRELYKDGGGTFTFAKRKFTLKLGFRRGAYEPFVKNYKSIPVFILTDITDGPDNYRVWNAGLAEAEEPYKVNALDGKYLSVLLTYDEVTVLHHETRDAPGKKAASFPYKELRELWARNAARYKVTYNGGPAYFVPQAFYNQSGCNSVGYVVSMPDPYFVDTGLPLDFVELYRYTKASIDRRRITYSIPMGMVFTRSADDGKKWEVRDMEKTSLYDAMDEEMDRPDECNSGLREAIKKAAAEN